MSNQTVGVSGLTSKNIIPEYAKDFKREYQLIKGINKKFSYLAYFMEEESEYDDDKFKDHKLYSVMKDIKKFLRAQEKGKLKDIRNLEFGYYDINNIYEIKKNKYDYYDTIRDLYDWSKYYSDDLSRYEIYKYDLELFLSKLNFENVDRDIDSDDLEIILSMLNGENMDSDSDSDNF